MLKRMILTVSVLAIALYGLASAQDTCLTTFTIGGVIMPPCEESRIDIPIYMDNPCTVGGFSIEIYTANPFWFTFDPDDPLAADTIGSRNTNWGVFGFQVSPYGYSITVTALGKVPPGVGQNLPPGDGLIFTVHGYYDNKIASDTCRAFNGVSAQASDTTGYISYTVTVIRDSLCVEACDTNLVRGDANQDGTLDGIDVTYLVSYLKGGPQQVCVGCPCLGDANTSGEVDGIDVLFLVIYFKGGPAPTPPNCTE